MGFCRPGDPTGAYIKKVGDLISTRYIEAQEEAFRARPRTLVHSDSRGMNFFEHRTTGQIALIDWQLWIAGPVAAEFPQMMQLSGPQYRDKAVFDKFLGFYYDKLGNLLGKDKLQQQYPLEQLRKDIHLATIQFFMLIPGFSMGSLPDYQLPENAKEKQKYKDWIDEIFGFLYGIGVLETLGEFIEGL